VAETNWILEAENLSYTYMVGTPYETPALCEVNCRIRAGEIVALMGATGSGKTTLVQHFNGLLQPAAGTVKVDGIPLTDAERRRSARKTVGLLFQFPEYQLFEETVFQDIAFGPRNLDIPEQEISGLVRESMEAVGLSFAELKDRSPFSLSGGEMRRVAMAGVLAIKPRVLIMDEPTAGLDPRGRDEILALVAGLNRERGLTLVMVSHSMDEVAGMAQRIMVMDRGALVGEGTPGEVFNRRQWLESLGLDLPDCSRLMWNLKEGWGLEVSTQAYTQAQATEEIIRLWNC